MLLKSLHLKNIKNHSDYKIDFTPGITAIIGKNGKGKSTILESIGFVLFDYIPYKQKEFITHGKTWGEIKLLISIGDIGNLVITRRIGNNPHYKITNGVGQDINGKEDVQVFIKEYLKTDMDLEKLYSEILAIPQGMATAHFLLPKTQRSQIFDSIMGVDVYRKCWSKLSGVERILKKRFTSLSKDTAILENEVKDYGNKKFEEEELEDGIKKLKAEVSVVKVNAEKLEVEFTDLNEMAGEVDQKEYIEDDIKRLKYNIDATSEELVDTDLNRMSNLKKLIESYDETDDELRKTLRESEALFHKHGDIDREICNAEYEIEDFEEHMKGYNSIKELVDELDYITEMKEKWMEDIIIAQAELDRLHGIGKDGICLFTKERCDKIKISVINEKIDMWEKRLQNATDTHADFDSKYWESKHAKDVKDKLDERNKQIIDVKNSLVINKKLRKKYSEEREIIEKKLKELDTKLKKMDSYRNEYNNLKLGRETNEVIKSQLERLSDEITDARKKIKDIEKKIVGFDGNRLEEVYQEMLIKNADLNTFRERCAQKELQLSILQSELFGLEEKQGELSEVSEKLRKTTDTLDKTKEIRKIFSEVGSKLTNSYLRNISYTANQIYQELMNTTETLSWESNYEVIVGDKKFNQLSGGQQMSAAISVRLALLKYFSSINLIILDEPTANLDDTRREALAESIGNLEKNNQILVVTHDDTFSTMTDNVVNL